MTNAHFASLSDDETKRRADLIVSQYGGIVSYFEAFYIEEVKSSAAASISAFNAFLEGVWRKSDSEVFGSFLSFLTHTAATSRFFWPPVAKNKALQSVTKFRGAKLRTAFNMQDDSALKNRKLRNIIEHYDEYLDEFLLQDPIGVMLPSPIITADNLSDDSAGHAFQFLNPVYEYAEILCVRVDYSGLLPELQRVLALAQTMTAQGGRLVFEPTVATPSSI
jgi:hypothetical protein